MILKAIHNLLSEDTAIATAVGSRIMPAGMDQDVALPYITHQIITTTPTEVLSGSAGLSRSVVQLNVYADTFAKVDEIAEDVRLATQGFSGVVDDAIEIDHIHLDDVRDQPTAPVDGAGKYLAGKQIDLGVWYVQAIPNHQ